MDAATAPSASDQLRAEFLRVLRSRRMNPDVSPSVELGGAVTEPVDQAPIFPDSREVMEACPRDDLEGFNPSFGSLVRLDLVLSLNNSIQFGSALQVA